jgi:uncharacterized YccA/Bax inhibitor family protein
MTMTNPAFRRNPAFKDKQNMSAEELQKLYELTSDNTVAERPMTFESTLMKSVFGFAVLIVGGVIGWLIVASNPAIASGVLMVSGIGAFVLAMVNIFKREPVPALILLYALLEGVLLGGISMMYNSLWDGIVIQAVIGTVAVFAVTLALFASGKVRVSKRATQIFFVVVISYVVFSLVNVLLMVTGVNNDPWGLEGIKIFGIPLGVIIGLLMVLMAAYSLVMDFTMIQTGIANKAPAKYEWTGVFSIMLTVVWLYMQILRILAISRGN